MFPETIHVVKAPNLEPPINTSLTPSTFLRVASKRTQTEMRAGMGYPTMCAGFDVGAAIKWAFPRFSLKCLEDRVTLFHPESQGKLLLQALCDVVVLREKPRFGFMFTKPRLFQDAEDEGPSKGIARKTFMQ